MSQRIGRGLLLVAFVVAVALVAPRAWNLFAGAGGIHDAASLPDRITVCDRDWNKDRLMRRSTLAEIQVRDGVRPIVVDPGLFAPCPPGPCTRIAQDGPCYTVIYVRVGEDAFLGYSLVGGP